MAEANGDRLPLPCFCPSWHNRRIDVCHRYIAGGFVCREFEKAIASVVSIIPNPPASSSADRAYKSSDRARRITAHNRRARKRQINSGRCCKRKSVPRDVF